MKLNKVFTIQNQYSPVFGKKWVTINQLKKNNGKDVFTKNETEKPKKPSLFKRFSTKAKMFWSAIAGAVVSGFAVLTLVAKKLRNTNIKSFETQLENEQLKNRLYYSQKEITNQQKKNEALEAKVQKVQSEKDTQQAELNEQIKRIQAEKEELTQTIKNISIPKNFDELVKDKTQELPERILDYNPLESPLRKVPNVAIPYTNKITIPKEKEQTNNRANMQILDYPVYIPSEPYHFKFPESDKIKTTKIRVPFKEQPLQHTTLSETYSDSLNWDNDKISRDLMQNFFDGHGQTLDGVSIDIIPIENGKHKVRISGKSVYSPDKAILLGESTKKDDPKAAGNFGEGLKMVVLKLLKEKGADNVNISSDNWSVNYKFTDAEIGDKRVLSYSLKKISEPVDGNYIEFETDDDALINSILNSYDNFYHSSNAAFRCPNFENDAFGIKLLDNKQDMGKIYIAGQAFEVNGNYLGCKGANIFIKEKPPVKVDREYIFDPSRDRTSLTNSNIKAIAGWLAKQRTTTDSDLARVLHTFEDYWSDYIGENEKSSQIKSFLDGFIDGIIYGRNIRFDFPEKYVADTPTASSELKQHYLRHGYRICKNDFEYIGMPSLKELVEESRQHIALEPTEKEKNKILLLKDAIKLFSPVLADLFSQDELKTKIFIFDKSAPNENRSSDDINAEAIIQSGKTLGFWIDRKYLKEDFPTILATALHELTHKYGGDESMRFSYKLTDVLKKVLAASTDNLYIATQLKVFEEAWNAQQE